MLQEDSESTLVQQEQNCEFYSFIFCITFTVSKLVYTK